MASAGTLWAHVRFRWAFGSVATFAFLAVVTPGMALLRILPVQPAQVTLRMAAPDSDG